jgi:prolyl 4-hydroxylase
VTDRLKVCDDWRESFPGVARHEGFMAASEDAQPMSTNIRLSSELKSWIAHNLERGCQPADLVASMVSQSFEPRVAHAVIDAFVNARAAGLPVPGETLEVELDEPEYLYETPRLARGNVIDAGDREIAVLLRLEQPTLAVLGGVLSDDECQQLLELAGPRLARSTVVDPLTGVNAAADYRNSEGMFFRLQETSFIARLDQRISRLMNAPVENGEGLQVLRYGPGGHSAPHFDFLLPSNTANEESLARSGQRMSTLIVYLNDVPEGGATVFAEIGLSVMPRRGHAVYFEYANSRQQLDGRSLHAGAPVMKGEKWAMTKWMRTRRFVPA